MHCATAAAKECDFFLVAGSSLAVYPAAGFPLLAKKHGAQLAIINREPTEQDAYAELVIHAGIGGILSSGLGGPGPRRPPCNGIFAVRTLHGKRSLLPRFESPSP